MDREDWGIVQYWGSSRGMDWRFTIRVPKELGASVLGVANEALYNQLWNSLACEMRELSESGGSVEISGGPFKSFDRARLIGLTARRAYRSAVRGK